MVVDIKVVGIPLLKLNNLDTFLPRVVLLSEFHFLSIKEGPVARILVLNGDEKIQWHLVLS